MEWDTTLMQALEPQGWPSSHGALSLTFQILHYMFCLFSMDPPYEKMQPIIIVKRVRSPSLNREEPSSAESTYKNTTEILTGQGHRPANNAGCSPLPLSTVLEHQSHRGITRDYSHVSPEWKHHLNRVLGMCRSCRLRGGGQNKERRRDSTVHQEGDMFKGPVEGTGWEGQETEGWNQGRHANSIL